MNPWEIFERGGPVTNVIAASSVLATSVFFERIWALRSARVAPRSLLDEIGELVRANKIPEALARAVGSQTSAGAVFAAMLRRAGRRESELREAASDVGRREAARLERHVDIVGVIAALGPLLGLLGTVLGMIKVFQRVNEVGAGSPVDMAAGIWEALIATAFGLVVAIPSLVMYRVLLSRVDGWVLRLEDEAQLLADALVEHRAASAETVDDNRA